MFDLYKVKSFSDNATKGNLAGVVTNAQFLTEIEMQNISAQVGASETSFILPSSSADVRIRWFTPNTEVGMCVHATIAALGVLRSRNELSSDTVSVETKHAILRCQFNGDNIFIKVPGYQQVSSNLNIAKILPILPLDIINIVRTPGIIKIFDDSELVIEVASFEDLCNLKPAQDNYSKICSELGVTGISIFTKETRDSQNQIHTREFAPLYGYLEDPLCGMAAGAICTYIKEKSIRIEQGYFCNTTGIIIAEQEAPGVIWIGGSHCIIGSDAASVARV